MKRSRAGVRKNRIGYNYLGMMGIALIVMILLGTLVFQSRELQSRLTAYDAKAASIEASIEEQHVRTEEIDRQKEYMQTDEYAEEVARDKLGLVKDNEIVFQEQQ